MQAFAQEGKPLSGAMSLPDLPRLAQEMHEQGLPPGQVEPVVAWEAKAQLRPRAGVADEVWLHLCAHANLPLTCQRCMGSVVMPVHIDQRYRFVATEDVAMAEDDEAEEDLLVMEPQFDLMALLEDELLMALPLVPMHELCPMQPKMQTDEVDLASEMVQKTHPFAVLEKLKKK